MLFHMSMMSQTWLGRFCKIERRISCRLFFCSTVISTEALAFYEIFIRIKENAIIQVYGIYVHSKSFGGTIFSNDYQTAT